LEIKAVVLLNLALGIDVKAAVAYALQRCEAVPTIDTTRVLKRQPLWGFRAGDRSDCV